MAWLPISGLAFAAFIFNTSEFLPVGLLPEMAKSLQLDVSTMGLIMTGYAWVVALTSLPLAILTAKIERRKLLFILLTVFAVCHFAVVFANSFVTLFITRIGVAFTHAIFWSIMSPLAARMAPAGRRAVGLSAVMGGTIVATVLGVPIGTKLGEYFGWHNAFIIIGMGAVLTLALLAAVLPKCPSTKAGSLASLPLMVKRPALIQMYLFTMITMLGQFTVYTYIKPILMTQGDFTESGVVAMLAVFGIAGILGTIIGSKYVDRLRSMTLTTALVLMSLCLLLIGPAAHLGPLVWAIAILWGAANTAACLALQSTVLDAAHDCADVATSLYSGIFNIGIGGGAFLGSLISQHYGFMPVNFAGGAIVALTASCALLFWFTTGSAILRYDRSPTADKGAQHTKVTETP